MLKVIEHRVSREVRAWLRQEAAEQKTRYKKIVEEQEALSPKRDKWVAEFLHRIQTRGFNVHADMRRQIPDSEMPKKPRRKFKVVF
jgi:hypothetical protein